MLLVIIGPALPVRAQQPSPSVGRTKNPSEKDVPDVKVLRDLEYVRTGEKKLLLDLYLPNKAKKPFPLIIWIHGGAWAGGDKINCPAAMNR